MDKKVLEEGLSDYEKERIQEVIREEGFFYGVCMYSSFGDVKNEKFSTLRDRLKNSYNEMLNFLREQGLEDF